jgi:regulator of protease activity HflC (stomatin/prohibitin superfamily)
MNRDVFLRGLIVSFLLIFLAACTLGNPAFTTESQTYTLEGEDAIQARSSDAINLYIDVTIVFEIAEENLELVQMRFPEGDYFEILIRPVVRTEAREVFAQYEAQDLWGFGISEIAQEFEDAVRDELANEGFTTSQVVIGMINFDEYFIATIEAIQIATLGSRNYEDVRATATQATINLRTAEARETATHTP